MAKSTKNSPAAIASAEKKARALDLKKQGWTYEQIAADLGYTDRSSAHKAVSAALRDLVNPRAEELRQLEAERLDALLAS